MTGRYEAINVGDRASLSLTASDAAVRAFAAATGDTNPIHLDEASAARSFFKRRVAHGMLAASLVSAVLGTRLPGPGSVYLSQTLDFKRPVYIGETITAFAEVTGKIDRQKKLILRTWVENGAGQAVLEGQAAVLAR